jgi:hypothetical protein
MDLGRSHELCCNKEVLQELRQQVGVKYLNTIVYHVHYVKYCNYRKVL